MIMSMYNPLYCVIEGAIDLQVQANRTDVEEGTTRFERVETNGVGYPRCCAYSAPLVMFGLLIAYVILQAHFNKQLLVMVE